MKKHILRTQIHAPTKELHQIVTKTLKSLGFTNNFGELYTDYPYIFIATETSFDRSRKAWHDYKTVTLMEFLELYYKEEDKPIEVKLDEKYTAKVFANKIVVGCSTFNVNIVENLAAALKTATENDIVDKSEEVKEKHRYALFTYSKPGYYSWHKPEVTDRKVQVQEEDVTYLKGVDTSDSVFKTFLKSRMTLLRYIEE